MATPVISRPTAVDSSPLLTIGDEKADNGVRLGRAMKLSTALTSDATAHQQDTSDGENETLEGEKEVEVQADTKDKPRPRPRPLPQPRLQPPAPVAAADAAPNGNKRLAPARPRPAASTKHVPGSTKTKGTGAKKQQRDASAVAPSKADAGSETAAADAGALDKSCLPFRRNKNGPRKGGKQKEKGALGRAYEKVRLIATPPDMPDRPTHFLFLESIHDPASPL